MGVILVFIGSLLLYAKSKHFPQFLNFVGITARQKPVLTRVVAYIVFLLSILIFTVQFDFATALVIFMITVMLALGLIITLLPLNQKYVYLFAGLSLVIIVMENLM
ncbi:hypothetical protein KIM67_00715 [Flagellimonas sp. 389]|uniref:hypothetical protein n=1 Tax=Flagellimonas sp. 389 TaxID=2835862 RepID=UPI001BD31503|nr:hypothetical protein [Flagellimonas sp. 389]MBS9460912.1 hypothetical protein [Flagellimonas sp. 389]